MSRGGTGLAFNCEWNLRWQETQGTRASGHVGSDPYASLGKLSPHVVPGAECR